MAIRETRLSRLIRNQGAYPHLSLSEREAFAALYSGDGQRALEILKMQAAVGSPVASYCIGDIYLHGQGGVTSNPAEAKKWYESAHTGGDTRTRQYAAIKLSYIYGAGYDENNNYGAAIDYGKAFSYLDQLDGSDIAMGLVRLGIMYEKGQGTPRDIKKAMELYRSASSLGHLIGRKCLASLKVRNGEVISGYLLWAITVMESIPMAIFNRRSRRLTMW